MAWQCPAAEATGHNQAVSDVLLTEGEGGVTGLHRSDEGRERVRTEEQSRTLGVLAVTHRDDASDESGGRFDAVAAVAPAVAALAPRGRREVVAGHGD